MSLKSIQFLLIYREFGIVPKQFGEFTVHYVEVILLAQYQYRIIGKLATVTASDQKTKIKHEIKRAKSVTAKSSMI